MVYLHQTIRVSSLNANAIYDNNDGGYAPSSPHVSKNDEQDGTCLKND